MTKVNLEYNYDQNSLRTNEANTSENGWQIIDHCDKDLADSFISVFESDRLLRFKNTDNLRFLLKDHAGQFLADKKRKEYAAAGKNIKVLYV